ncbi:MAG: phosphoenolpyruvate carboxylase [Alphaproteobacteria bacterium]|nr:phosphoenolpyruvate carboxylase [Alphaproteobacteria bacterium]
MAPSPQDIATPTSRDPRAWADWCLARLEAYEQEAAFDPLTNSVRRLAHDLTEAQGAGVIDHAGLAAAAKALCDAALLARADAFGAAHGCGGVQTAVDACLARFEGADFTLVKEAVERARAGAVFTAHPTFAMSRALRAAFAARACAKDEAARRAAAARVAGLAHAPDRELSLADEHVDAQAAIMRAQDSIAAAVRAILIWAKARYPDRWTQLSPAPLTLATWVGYDLDGRTDIHWSDTFRLRLEEKAAQLRRYARAMTAAIAVEGQAGAERILKQLEAAADFASEQAALFAGDFSDPAIVTAAANALTRDDPRRLVSLKPVIEALDALIEGASDDEARLSLCVLRSEMKNCGLGVARVHLRINAAQIRSALRGDFDLDPNRQFLDRTALDIAAEKAAEARARKINIASIFFEEMTAHRQFMLAAEFAKHIDADTPIRFLIAECEAPATVMGAVYLARLYGVEKLLDISPLFETPEAIERGGRLMERLVAAPAFVDYIRARGRIAIQLGFSDSGRFMGQVAANLAIERLHILFSRALAHAGLTDVEAVIFNTHGESMGRGGYPGDMQARLDYLMTPWARARYAHDGVALCAESSFQGGDGYLHFETEALASATVCALLNWAFEQPAADRSDRFYADINYSWDFYRAVKTWQEQLFDNPDYQATIGVFAPGILFATGSRRARRQSGAVVVGPRALRAIPHNAILQQMSAPVNVCGGIGEATGAEIDRLEDLANASARMAQVLGLVRRARALTSLPALRSYAVIFDASFWIAKAARRADGDAAILEEIALRLSSMRIPVAFNRLANHLAADLSKLDRVFRDIEHDESVGRRKMRRPIHALHAIRQAMIMRAFMLVAGLPGFSPRHDVSRESMFDLAFELRFDELADTLEVIFPASNANVAALAGIEEPADPPDAEIRGYPEIQANVIAPLREIHRAIREIGVGVAHFYGAYG